MVNSSTQTGNGVTDKSIQSRKRKLVDDDASSGKKKVLNGLSKNPPIYRVVKENSSSTLGLLTFADVICQLMKRRLLKKLQDKEQKMMLLKRLSDKQHSLLEYVLSELRSDVVRESNNAIAMRKGNQPQPRDSNETWARKLLNDNQELIMGIFIEFMMEHSR